MSQGNEKGFNPSMKDNFNLLYVVAKGHSACFLPFLRATSEVKPWAGRA